MSVDPGPRRNYGKNYCSGPPRTQKVSGPLTQNSFALEDPGRKMVLRPFLILAGPQVLRRRKNSLCVQDLWGPPNFNVRSSYINRVLHKKRFCIPSPLTQNSLFLCPRRTHSIIFPKRNCVTQLRRGPGSADIRGPS